jgi:hypothetical protein
MVGKPNIPLSVEKNILDQIVYYEQKVKDLQFALKMMRENPPPQLEFFPINPKLTKDLIRRYMQAIKKPVQTIEVVDQFFHNVTDETRTKAIKTLSVIFNTLERDGLIRTEKREGIKGNFYTWIGNDDMLTVDNAADYIR